MSAKRKKLEADLRLLSQGPLQSQFKMIHFLHSRKMMFSFCKFSETKLSLVVLVE
jgi:hypothetical protein